MNNIIAEKITKARSQLVLNNPFFGCLVLKLKMIENKHIETAFVNSKEIHYNPDFIEALTPAQLKAVLAHEVLHIALGHNWRMGNRDNNTWQMAADYAINTNLFATGFDLPEGALIDNKYKDMSAEEIYNDLFEEQQQQQENEDDEDNTDHESHTDHTDHEDDEDNTDHEDSNNTPDPGRCGAVQAEKLDTEEAKQQQAEWKAAAIQAAQIAKGDLPAELERQIKELIDPPLPWYVLLRDFVEQTARNDYNWNRPSPRYLNKDIILPSLISEELPEIVIAIDTSGSINEEQLNHFAHEVSNVLSAYNTTIRLMYCDADVQKEEVFTREDLPLNMKAVGGGGTDFRPVFEHITKQGIMTACLIYFTDLYGSFPSQQPEYPVLWVSVSDGKAPFGLTVPFKFDERN